MGRPVPATTLGNRQIAAYLDNRGLAWATGDLGDVEAPECRPERVPLA